MHKLLTFLIAQGAVVAILLLSFLGPLPPAEAGSMMMTGAGSGNVILTIPQFDPVKSSSGVNLTNSNLTAAGTVSGFTCAIGIPAIFQSTGKFYAEFTAGTVSGANVFVGIQNSSAAVTAVFPGSSSNGVGYTYSTGGRVIINSTNVATIGTFTTGSVVSMAVILDPVTPANQQIWFRVGNGNWNGSGTANPATGVGGISLSTLNAGPYVPTVTLQANGDSLTANFGATSYAESVPSGFGNW
jgi:hypothetical protein